MKVLDNTLLTVPSSILDVANLFFLFGRVARSVPLFNLQLIKSESSKKLGITQQSCGCYSRKFPSVISHNLTHFNINYLQHLILVAHKLVGQVKAIN